MSHPRRARRAPALLLLAALVAPLAACDEGNPAEVRDTPQTFPLRANWSASAAPVNPATVRATLAVKEYLGFRMEATLSLTGAPNTAYQWRIFRGDCATTAVAANNTAPTGLLLFSTVQAYPNVTTNASGAATVTTTIAGALDSLTAYSVRVRVAQTSTAWNGTSPVACGNLHRSQGT